MILKDIKSLFFEELINIYTQSECSELFSIFSEELLGFDKISLRKNLDRDISPKLENDFLTIISELKTGKPYQQILGKATFCGYTFFIDENVLIPRPETEELVELITNRLYHKKNDFFKILDIGTGSGCISISLAKYFPNAKITSIDISEKALRIAKKNADFHKVNIDFIQKDYLVEKPEDIYDLIVSNPPYIDFSEEPEIPVSVKKFEPNIALFAPKNRALAFYEKIAKDCENHLSEEGYVFLEINQKLGIETLSLFKKKFSKSLLLKDLSENDRFILIQK